MPSDEFTRHMSALQRAAAAGGDLSAAAAQVTAHLLDLDALTLSVRSAQGTLELLWFDPADTLGPTLDDLQYTLGEGPTWDALRTGRTVTAADLHTVPAARWPAFTPAVTATAARAVIATPLRLGAITPGVLTGYRTTAGPFPPDQQAAVDRFARTALELLLHTPLAPLATGHPLTGGLDLHRAEVHQAVGILSVRLHLPVEQALLRLRAHAWRQNRPLLDIARDILAHRLDLED